MVVYLALTLLALAALAVGGLVVSRSLSGQLGGSLADLGGTLGEIESRLDRGSGSWTNGWTAASKG